MVVNPAFAMPSGDTSQRGRDAERVSCVAAAEPTGMLDAILLAMHGGQNAVEPASVWITWCDQVAVHPRDDRAARRAHAAAVA